MIRVIAGSAKGQLINIPDSSTTRAITDRLKVKIFDLLGERIIDAKVLDLYAGSGALGIESLSRGAAKSWFIDNSGEAVSLINKNLRITQLEEKGIVIKADLPKYIQQNYPKSNIKIYRPNPEKKQGITKLGNFSHKLIKKEQGRGVEQEFSNTQFDIIFCDPPYTKLYNFQFRKIKHLINKSSIFILRLPNEINFADELTRKHKDIELFTLENAGISNIYFLGLI